MLGKSARKILKGSVKLGGAAAVIWCVGWFVLTLQPHGEVEESSADIFEFTSLVPTNSERFARALDNLGHETPRVYEYNGNTVFFSTRNTHKSPRELLGEYQAEFVGQDLNEREYGVALDELQSNTQGENAALIDRGKAILSGQIVPLYVDSGYLSMGGGLTQGNPTTRSEFEEEQRNASHLKFLRFVDELGKVYGECGGGSKFFDIAMTKVRRSDSGSAQDPLESDPSLGSCSDGLFGNSCSEQADDYRIARQKFKALMGAMDRQKSLFSGCQAFREFHGREKQKQKMGFDTQFKGFRSIEAFRDQSGGGTTVTAVWSDDQFDVSKTLIHKYGATNAQFDPAIPLCADCVSTWKFGGSGDESGYRSNLMMSQESPQNLQAFYLGAMRNRGWESSESELVLNALHQHAGHPDADRREARFSRGDEQMTMVFRYDSVADATKITVQRTD